jgi:hypothetical protein
MLTFSTSMLARHWAQSSTEILVTLGSITGVGQPHATQVAAANDVEVKHVEVLRPREAGRIADDAQGMTLTAKPSMQKSSERWQL